MVVEFDWIELLSLVPSNCSGSRDEVDIRWAVNNGDLAGTSSALVCGPTASCVGLRTGASSTGDLNFGALGVFDADAEDGGRCPDREDVDECRDWGLEVLSCASSNVSCEWT